MIFFCFASKGNFQSEGVRTPSTHRRNLFYFFVATLQKEANLNFHNKYRILGSILNTVEADHEIMITILQKSFIFFADFTVQPWLM